MSERLVREWTRNWPGPVRAVEVSAIEYQRKEPGRKLPELPPGRGPGGMAPDVLAEQEPFLPIGLVSRVLGWVFRRPVATRVVWVRSYPEQAAFAFVAAANGPGRRWLVFSGEDLAVLRVGRNGVEHRWSGQVEWMEHGELRWVDGGWVRLPAWVAAGRPPRYRRRAPD